MSPESTLKMGPFCPQVKGLGPKNPLRIRSALKEVMDLMLGGGRTPDGPGRCFASLAARFASREQDESKRVCSTQSEASVNLTHQPILFCAG